MAITYTSNLVIYTGTDFDQTFALEDDQSNSALDLTGYSGCAQLKRYESSSKAADFTVSFANERDTGRVTISIGSTQSSSIKPGKYFYDLLLNSPTGTTTRVIEGTALVKKSVTR
jgi:hypothetical protein